MAKLEYATVQLENGKILDGEKTGEILGEYSIVQAVN